MCGSSTPTPPRWRCCGSSAGILQLWHVSATRSAPPRSWSQGPTRDLGLRARQALSCLHKQRVAKVQKTLKQTVASDMEPKLGAQAFGTSVVCHVNLLVAGRAPVRTCLGACRRHNRIGRFLALKAGAEVAGSPAHPEESSQRRQAPESPEFRSARPPRHESDGLRG